ncbi:MAG TPA: hypothetical protein VNN62_14995 [Methylomirabilota bacterium]|jgi:hypothetical protein|nr:hypothetical protein [Methylomirabilota bacterium]
MAGKDVERLKEQIKYETELLKAALLITVATGGGSISLLLGEWTSFRLSLAGLGLLITLVAVIGVRRQDRMIRTLIAQLPEEL